MAKADRRLSRTILSIRGLTQLLQTFPESETLGEELYDALDNLLGDYSLGKIRDRYRIESALESLENAAESRFQAVLTDKSKTILSAIFRVAMAGL